MAADMKATRHIFSSNFMRVFALLCAAPGIASAESLTDPTKPPAEVSTSVASQGGSLRSIFISPTHRAAIIDGQTVELGAKHGDIRLIEVSESGVVLQGSQGRQILELFPGVEIRKKEVLPSMENDMKRPSAKFRKGSVRKVKLVDKPTSHAGNKEGK